MPGMTRVLATVSLFLLASFAITAQNLAADALHDALARELDPGSNFGGAGLLCVAGTASVNDVGQPRGRFDTAMKFDVSAALATFD